MPTLRHKTSIENFDVSKRFNPKPIQSMFRRLRDAQEYLRYRGWKVEDRIGTSPNQEDRFISKRKENCWVIIRSIIS